jgi:hypothetical protein
MYRDPSRFIRAFLASAALVSAASTVVFAETMPEGPVTMARTHGDATAVWDATDELAELIGKKTGKDEILRTLEADATQILTKRAQTLKGNVDSFKVTVIYQRTGAISPKYQVATFLGLERLLAVKATMPLAQNNSDWSSQIRAGKPPKDVEISIIGNLPPEIH